MSIAEKTKGWLESAFSSDDDRQSLRGLLMDELYRIAVEPHTEISAEEKVARVQAIDALLKHADSRELASEAFPPKWSIPYYDDI